LLLDSSLVKNMTGDNQVLINDCQDDLDRIDQFITSDPLNSLNSYLISYCVIRACGTIEMVVKNIIFDHLIIGATQESINYFEKDILESSWNPHCGAIQKILDKINSNWSATFQHDTNGIKEKGDLTSLVNLRNQFAHGQKITATISNVKDYFIGGCKIVEILDNIVK